MPVTKKIALAGGPFNADNALIIGEAAIDIGTRVIKWYEEDGFGQYEQNRVTVTTEDMKTGKVRTRVIQGKRYKSRPGGVAGIRQVLIHHSGADRADPAIMREVLHNQRGLSVQFAIEDDGRIYQFLNAAEMAFHAGKVHNKISVGAECCLWPDAAARPNYYSPANRKRTGNLPHKVETQVLQGMKKRVFCFPQPQVEATARWAAGIWLAVCMLGGRRTGKYNVGFNPAVELAQMFKMAPKFPRNIKGEIPREVFGRHADHVGLIGHLQCSKRKWDPAGFPWEKFEERVGHLFWQFAEGWPIGRR